jgi:hypothetical protein
MLLIINLLHVWQYDSYGIMTRKLHRKMCKSHFNQDKGIKNTGF